MISATREREGYPMRQKVRLSLETTVNGKRQTLAVLPGKGVVQAWVVAERLDSPDRVTLQLSALDSRVAGTDTLSRWRVAKLRVGDSVEIRVLSSSMSQGYPPAKVTRHELPAKRERKRKVL